MLQMTYVQMTYVQGDHPTPSGRTQRENFEEVTLENNPPYSRHLAWVWGYSFRQRVNALACLRPYTALDT